MEIKINVRYDGLDASAHQIGMRQFGQSLIGLDRALTFGLTALAERRFPKPREKAQIIVRASAPQIGCVDFDAIIATAPGVLPIILTLYHEHGAEIAWKFISGVLNRMGGKPKEADKQVSQLIDLLREQTGDRQLERQFVLAVMDRLRPVARDIVAPVGSSCETLSIGRPGAATLIDTAMADATRSKEFLEVGEMMRIRIRVDGVIKHNRSLKVEFPDNPGRFVTADVRDPCFDQTPNAYTEALAGDGFLDVDAKPTYRQDGEMAKLYIMNVAA